MSSIEFDSRDVKVGSVFVALGGEFRDGHEYIDQAIENGAILVVGERDAKDFAIPYLTVPSAVEALARLSGELYGYPGRKLKVIGVTGTSGKTTTTYILEAIFKSAGAKVGVIGTVNYRFGGKGYSSYPYDTVS